MLRKCILILVCAILLGPALPAPGQAAQHVSIGTNPVGMALYTMGASITEVLRKSAPDIALTVEATNGNLQNALLLAKGDIEIGFVSPKDIFEAYTGTGRFKTKVPVLGMFSPVLAYQQNAALASSGIKDMRGLRSKRVGIGPPGAQSRMDASLILPGYGMSFDDFKGFSETLPEMVEKMKNGQLDATLWFGVSPLGPLMDLEQARDVVWLPADPEAVKPIVEKYPYYFMSELPAGTYSKQDKAVPVLAQRYNLVARADVPEDVVYTIVKSVFSNLEQLRGIYKGWQSCSPETALQSMTIPLHPGAIRYFKEINLPGLEEYMARTAGM